MAGPATTGLAADLRARIGDLGVRVPVKADREQPGYIIGADGTRVAGVAARSLGLDADMALKLAESIAAAINWYAGVERK